MKNENESHLEAPLTWVNDSGDRIVVQVTPPDGSPSWKCEYHVSILVDSIREVFSDGRITPPYNQGNIDLSSLPTESSMKFLEQQSVDAILSGRRYILGRLIHDPDYGYIKEAMKKHTPRGWGGRQIKRKFGYQEKKVWPELTNQQIEDLKTTKTPVGVITNRRGIRWVDMHPGHRKIFIEQQVTQALEEGILFSLNGVKGTKYLGIWEAIPKYYPGSYNAVFDAIGYDNERHTMWAYMPTTDRLIEIVELTRQAVNKLGSLNTAELLKDPEFKKLISIANKYIPGGLKTLRDLFNIGTKTNRVFLSHWTDKAARKRIIDVSRELLYQQQISIDADSLRNSDESWLVLQIPRYFKGSFTEVREILKSHQQIPIEKLKQQYGLIPRNASIDCKSGNLETETFKPPKIARGLPFESLMMLADMCTHPTAKVYDQVPLKIFGVSETGEVSATSILDYIIVDKNQVKATEVKWCYVDARQIQKQRLNILNAQNEKLPYVPHNITDQRLIYNLPHPGLNRVPQEVRTLKSTDIIEKIGLPTISTSMELISKCLAVRDDHELIYQKSDLFNLLHVYLYEICQSSKELFSDQRLKFVESRLLLIQDFLIYDDFIGLSMYLKDQNTTKAVPARLTLLDSQDGAVQFPLYINRTRKKTKKVDKSIRDNHNTDGNKHHNLSDPEHTKKYKLLGTWAVRQGWEVDERMPSYVNLHHN